MKYLFKLGVLALIALAVIRTNAAFTNTTDFFNGQSPHKLDF